MFEIIFSMFGIIFSMFGILFVSFATPNDTFYTCERVVFRHVGLCRTFVGL